MNFETVVFRAPYDVAVEQKLDESDLAADEVEVKALYSAISAGTEMLVYRGLMPGDVAADEVFGEMSKPFEYPASYGYSLVGKIDKIGSSVDETARGLIVFAFRPHQSRFRCKMNELITVPEDVDPDEAVFLPNVETAVSLVMDASPGLGDSVAVIGQGIVGLLVTTLIGDAFPFCNVVTADPIESRRELSATIGANHTVDASSPGAVETLRNLSTVSKEFPGADVTIEVSGSGAGLEAAISATGRGGKIVLGSWFGSKQVQLRNLGGAFHRSHISIIASQVSSLPPSVTGRWSKDRRFELTWKVLRRIKPKRFISRRIPLSEAPDAYRHINEFSDQIQTVIQYPL